MHEVSVVPLDPARLLPFLSAEQTAALEQVVRESRVALAGRTVWNINSTASGGGVAEMLRQVVAYGQGGGVDARWLVMPGTSDFFAVTKRLHNQLHGKPGDGGPLGDAERTVYERTIETAAAGVTGRLRPGDLMVLHDPQPAGLAAAVAAGGNSVVWRCHVGADRANEWTERAWAFLRPYLESVRVQVYTREAYVPPGLPRDQWTVIAPAIDPFAPKNAPMSGETARAVLARIGVLAEAGSWAGPDYRRDDGSVATVARDADIVRDGSGPGPDDPLVVQVSRWDRLKDMAGVLQGFAEHVATTAAGERAHLALVGPDVKGVSDDPEGAEVFEECVAAWKDLPDGVRRRISLVSLPMDDAEENAAMVNAVQRHAAVVVQKSLAEGFGLTVAEAMWKARPVVGSRVGGIVDQVADGCGVLLDDPTDLGAFGAAVGGLLADQDRAARYGATAMERVRSTYLPDRQLAEWAAVLRSVS